MTVLIVSGIANMCQPFRALDAPLQRQALRPRFNSRRSPRTRYPSNLNNCPSLSSRRSINNHSRPINRNSRRKMYRKTNNLSLSISTNNHLPDSSSISIPTGIPPRKISASVLRDFLQAPVFLVCHMVLLLVGILPRANPFITLPLVNTTPHNHPLVQWLSHNLRVVLQAHQLPPPSQLHLLRQ